MKRQLLLFSLLVGCIMSAIAQPNDSIARACFHRADSAYNASIYGKALDELQDAEYYAGGANSRSLYLKVKALGHIVAKDSSAAPMLVITGRRFIAATDTDIYPAARYYEVVNLVAAHRTLANYMMRRMEVDTAFTVYNSEAEDYYMAVRENTIDGYQLFLDKYSYTAHYGEVQGRYKELADADWQYRLKHDKAVRKRLRWANWDSPIGYGY